MAPTSDAGLASLVYLGLLVLLVRQMETTRTPAGISPISRWSFIFQALMDSFAFTSVRVPSSGRTSLDSRTVAVAYDVWDID